MTSSGATGRPINILMVEDDPADADLTVRALQHAKVANHLSVVEDGDEALAFLRRQGDYVDAPRPDLILLDLNLPGRHGQEVLADIKADDQLKSIPVVVLTTSQDEAEVLRAYRGHANCYITKPVDLNQFIRVVETIDSFWLSVVTLPRDRG